MTRPSSKRSLAAGILDGGTGEISLGGSRLNRFMKDVENVTGNMGKGEVVSAAEETGNVVASSGEPVATASAKDRAAVGAETQAADDAAPNQADADPWGALLQIGAQLVSVLTASGDGAAASHPWIERDPATGSCSLKVPLPPPETARKIADALSVLAETLRGGNIAHSYSELRKLCRVLHTIGESFMKHQRYPNSLLRHFLVDNSKLQLWAM